MTEKLAAEIVKKSEIMRDTGMTSATPKPRAGEHTPAPWYSDQDGFIYTERDDEDQIVVAKAHEHPRMNTTLMNARRIVACVNACEGIGTETLENGNTIQRALMGGLQAGLDCDALAAQKRELKDGLAKSVQYIQQLASMVNTLKPNGVHAEDFTEPARNLLRRIK